MRRSRSSSPVTAARSGAPAAWIAREVDVLAPGSFALVMATGIIANAFYFQGPRALSDILLAINLAAYCSLLAATLLRALRAPRALGRSDQPAPVFLFFTLVAATDVLGVGILLRGMNGVAMAMWLVALVPWLGFIYLSFGVLIFRNSRQTADIVLGGWLIAIVGTESLVILGTFLARSFGTAAPTIFVLAHMLWGLGLALYGIYITLFAQRIFFFDFEPDDITPLLWVVMGAAAISTNAGTALIANDSQLAFLRSMQGFIDGVTL